MHTSAAEHRKALVLLANAEPEELEDRILRLTLEMVICSEATGVVRVPVKLYPGCGPGPWSV